MGRGSRRHKKISKMSSWCQAGACSAQQHSLAVLHSSTAVCSAAEQGCYFQDAAATPALSAKVQAQTSSGTRLSRIGPASASG